MKVKKYPQSHLVLEKNGKKIMIDPGDFTFENGFKVEEFKGVEAILITHTHPDHLAQRNPDEFNQVTKGRKIFGNSDVVSKLKELGIDAETVKDGEKFKFQEFEITPVDLPHCPPPPGVDVVMPPNTGFIIDGILFDPGDGYAQPGDLTIENVALPIAGPTITLESALKFAQDLQAKVVIPIHYNGHYKADPEQFRSENSNSGIDIRVLNFGEETEI